MLGWPQHELTEAACVELAESGLPQSNRPLSGGLTVAFPTPGCVATAELCGEQQGGTAAEAEGVRDVTGLSSDGPGLVHGDSRRCGSATARWRPSEVTMKLERGGRVASTAASPSPVGWG